MGLLSAIRDRWIPRSGGVEISSYLDKEMKSLVDTEIREILSGVRSLQPERQLRYLDYTKMLTDSLIHSAAELVAEDAVQPDNETGVVMWAVSEDPEIADFVNTFLWDVFRMDENAFKIAFQIFAYGEVFYRTFFSDDVFKKENDLGSYFEMVTNPLAVMEVMKYGKSKGFIFNPGDEDFVSDGTNFVTNKDTLLCPSEDFIHFVNDKGLYRQVVRYKKFDKRSTHLDAQIEEKYIIRTGSSFLDAAREAYRALNLIENILLQLRLTRSIYYRVFQVEVPQDRVEAMEVLREVKNAISAKERMNIGSERPTKNVVNRESVSSFYESVKAPLPVGGSIIVPTRQGKGNLQIETVGGDADMKDLLDLEYFKAKVMSAIKVPPSYLASADLNPGGLGNTALTRQDIRYCRTVKRVQNILRNGSYDLCNFYLACNNKKDWLGQFELKMSRVSSAEESDYREEITARVSLAESINNLIQGLSGAEVDQKVYVSYLIDKVLKLSDFKVFKSYGEKSEDEDL